MSITPRSSASARFRIWLIAALWLACTAARAEWHALLVGVSGYPTLPDRLHLEGPRNDVQRMRRVLMTRGFADARIQMLADGVPGAGSPTRANILGALEALANTAQSGDTVYIHFSGHGSRQPADRRNPSGREEPGGLVETFLPIDVGAWDEKTGTVTNAIVNFELRAAIDRISARGAFVWGVFDACHSATLVRGSESRALRYRHVESRDLQVPQAAIDAALAKAPPATRGAASDPQGSLDFGTGTSGARRASAVFFYASQIHELTPELLLPSGSAGAEPYGLFSFVVSRAIERAVPMTYRQMSQYILSEYGAIIEARATPLFSGDGLDLPVLGQASPPIRQWPLEMDGGPGVAVGALFGVGPGAVFALYPGPLSQDAERLGYLRIQSTRATFALLEPAPFDGHAALATASLKAGQYLRIVRNPLKFTLRVGFDPGTCAPDCPLREAIRFLRAQGAPGVDLQWIETGASPEILIQSLGDRALFLPLTQQADANSAKRSAWGVDAWENGKPLPAAVLATRIAQELHSIARARNLLSLATDFAAREPAGSLAVTLQRASDGTRPGAAIAPEQVPTLRNHEQLSVLVENRDPEAQDVTLLYIDADCGIQTLFPRAGESNRVESGGRQTVDGIVFETPPAGMEHLLLIAVRARPHSERTDLSFLEQPALARVRGAASPDLQVFWDAAFADFRTRGAERSSVPSDRTRVMSFTLNVVP